MRDMKHALVVDDDESMLEFCAALLALEGFAVTAASSGVKAQILLDCFAFDLVLTDHVSVPDGRSVASLAKSGWPDTDVIVMTARPTEEDSTRSLQEGARAYFAKPFNVTELRDILRECRER